MRCYCRAFAPLSLGLTVSLLLVFPYFAGAQEAASPPRIEAAQADKPPVIDGYLDEECWDKASRLEEFFCLDLSAERCSPEETVGLICSDDKAIYLGVICYDASPQDIAALETRRGGDIYRDDCVEFRLYPWGPQGEYDYYEFSVNPLGTQAETIPGGSATKIEWRGDWEAATMRTPAGWQAEMAIPFSILRYEPGETEFAFSITRRLHEENLKVCYPRMGRVYTHVRTATLCGLETPGREQTTILMPYFTADFGEYRGKRYDAGLDMQHKLPSGLTILASVNPDFKQIEDVVEPISFSYTERRLDDLRPFFVTGQDGYLPWSDLLYTRRIEDFDTGLKLFGKVGNETIGVLDAVTFGEENSFAAQWQHHFSDQPDTNASLSVVTHSKDGQPDNMVYSLGTSRFWRSGEGADGYWASVNQSEDYGGATGGEYTFGGETYHGAGKFQGWFELRMVTDDYNPSLGYTPEVDYKGLSTGFGLTDRYDTGKIEEKGWYVSANYWPHIEGEGILWSRFHPSYQWEWRDGTELNVGFTVGRRENTDAADGSVGYEWNNKDIYRRGEAYFLVGNRLGGRYKYFNFRQGFRPTDRLSLNLDFSYSDLSEPAEDAGHDYLAVLTGTYDLTTEKSISTRLIQRPEGLSGYASYRQVVRKGIDVYVILGDPDPELTGFTERLVVKLIWVI